MDRRHLIRAAVVAGTGLAAASACGTVVAGRNPAVSPSRQHLPAPTPDPPTPVESSAPAVALPVEIVRGPASRAAVALTFHGQGNPLMVRQLLGEIESGGAQATIMAVGSWLATQPKLARWIIDHGHELGNHTQNHVDIARLPAPAAYAEIDECAQVLRRLTGTPGRWFRPSQTQHATPVVEAAARRAGYPVCLSYDVDSLDYTDPPPSEVVNTVLSQVGNGSIVSLHCGHATTISAIGPILEGLRIRGLRAVTVSRLVDA
jgi:peptidoglycan/xylan/chitin deacetylase (PgdA/CDA1 family)